MPGVAVTFRDAYLAGCVRRRPLLSAQFRLDASSEAAWIWPMSSCPSAITTRLSAFKTSRHVVRTPLRGRKSHLCSARGYASSSPLTVVNDKTQWENSRLPKPEALTLLHKTSIVVPRVLETVNDSPGFLRIGDTSSTWGSILSDAHQDLSTASERPAKIVGSSLDHNLYVNKL